jgi:hypothetical protein
MLKRFLRINISLLFFLLLGCGDIMSNKKPIGNGYYLLRGESEPGLSICYHSGDVFVEKVPPDVVKYGYSDSFLVAETKHNTGITDYYIINMHRDKDTAIDKKSYLVGPLTEEEFTTRWSRRLNITLRNAN